MERISPKLLKISSKVSWVTFRDKYLILTLFWFSRSREEDWELFSESLE